MQEKDSFDFWYAVNNTEVVVRPRQQLETFGSTTLHYHLVAETMDSVNRIRVREGRIHAYRPQIITMDSISSTLLEGFSEEQSTQYMDWLRQNEANLVMLQYGFAIRKEFINEHLVSDSMEAVLERVKAEVGTSTQPMHALIRGVDEPWEVCLLQLMVEVIQQSVGTNAHDLRRDPGGIRHQIDEKFREASRDRSQIPALSRLLENARLFKEYEERFFALVRSGNR
jgi:hypothetical protein